MNNYRDQAIEFLAKNIEKAKEEDLLEFNKELVKILGVESTLMDNLLSIPLNNYTSRLDHSFDSLIRKIQNLPKLPPNAAPYERIFPKKSMINSEWFPTNCIFNRKELAGKMSNLMESNGIDTPLRISHFLAQLAHESDGFRTATEYGSDYYFNKNYGNRSDLGNISYEDGARFKGRGLIQVTGRYNYGEFFKWVKTVGYTSHPQVINSDPAFLESLDGVILTGIWYWTTRGLNSYADSNDIYKITRIINGGYNGLNDRQYWFNYFINLIENA